MPVVYSSLRKRGCCPNKACIICFKNVGQC